MRIKRAPKLSRDTIEYGHTQKCGGEKGAWRKELCKYRRRNKRKITIFLHFRLIFYAHHCAEEADEQLWPLPDHQFPRDPPDSPAPAPSTASVPALSPVFSRNPPTPLTTASSGAPDDDSAYNSTALWSQVA